jgi:hypothetical protein
MTRARAGHEGEAKKRRKFEGSTAKLTCAGDINLYGVA